MVSNSDSNIVSQSFKEKLLSNRFLITGEISPPKGTDISTPLANAKKLQKFADAVNVTDNRRAMLHMSSISFSKILLDHGFSDPVMQITCRDRNRIGLQSDLLGAAALGIPNLLIMSGDHPATGDHPSAKSVYDLDSIQLLGLIQKMKKGVDFSDRPLFGAPDFCVGVVANTDPAERLQLMKLDKKLAAGVDFIQTQAVFDIEKFKEFLEKVNTDVPILAGVIPIQSAQMIRHMNQKVPGIAIPDEVLERIVAAEDPIKEGVQIASELIVELKPLCRGVHMMPIGPHTNTEKILKDAHLL